jgi:hypothetical protein
MAMWLPFTRSPRGAVIHVYQNIPIFPACQCRAGKHTKQMLLGFKMYGYIYTYKQTKRLNLRVRGEIKNKGDSFNKKTTIRDSKVFISELFSTYLPWIRTHLLLCSYYRQKAVANSSLAMVCVTPSHMLLRLSWVG